jgi:pimeloyl-ACP methyl ester carboxylesterase
LKRRWKVLIGAGVLLAVLLLLNTLALDNETKAAETTIEGGEILELSGGEVQVYEDPVSRPDPNLPPIVLLHCYSCSLHWWDRMAPDLTDAGHRVIRMDLLGHGGSAKPSSGYGIDAQASLVAEAMNQTEVEGAVVVGHSMGGAVASALAESSSELVDRVVIIDEAAEDGQGSLSLLARAQYVPVLGEALFRVGGVGPWSDAVIKDGYAQAFAPGYDLADGFPNPDQVVNDLEAMTYTSFDSSHSEARSFIEERPLTERLTAAAVPLLVIFGDEDQIYDDPAAALETYEEVPGAITEMIDGAGHSPNVEAPGETAALIEDFAAEAVAAKPRRAKKPRK